LRLGQRDLLQADAAAMSLAKARRAKLTAFDAGELDKVLYEAITGEHLADFCMKSATRVVPQFSEIDLKCSGSTADIEQLPDHGADVHFEPRNVRCSLLELEIVRACRPSSSAPSLITRCAYSRSIAYLA
jgi:hypothetical protein